MKTTAFSLIFAPGMIWDQLEKAGVPGVCGVWSPPEGGNRLMTVVALKTQYLGHAKQAGLIASQCSGGIEMNRLTVVVDDHVDVTNIQDVVWAISRAAIPNAAWRSSRTPRAAGSTWPSRRTGAS